MTRSELNRLGRILKNKQEELSRPLGRREEIAIEATPDTLDEVQHASDRELALETLDRNSRILRDIRDALERMSDGSYGVCLDCEEPISSRRLAAIPWARYCIRCQEIADRSRPGLGEIYENQLYPAA